MQNEKLATAWLRDMPQQFQGKRKIGILVRALSRQLEEVERVLEEINTLTHIETAHGKNLDYVGDIVCMSRKEAGELVKKRFQEPVISDERYREYLRYQVLRNTSECTYADIMKAIDILWDVDKAKYYEREDRPATIFIGLPAVDIEGEDQAKGKPDILKPGGVGFIYTTQYGMTVDHRGMERVYFSRLNIHAYFRFFEMRILNGEWLLDGSVHLGQRPRWQMGVGILYGILRLCQKETVECPGMRIFLRVPDVRVRHVCGLKVMLPVLSADGYGAVLKDVGIVIPVPEAEKAESETVVIRKDLWHLDGAEILDGSRILDAEIREERL